MQLPRGDEYNQAIQNPGYCFSDSALKVCKVETNNIGLPKPYSGGFTTTYNLYNGKEKYAVRCFTREIKELEKRYKEINNFFLKNNSAYFVKAEYLQQGIKVNGKHFPIIKMKWIDGESLNMFIDKNYQNKQVIQNLLAEFQKLIAEIENHGIAHGDLQHGNILVNSGKLFLIDYDGMYLPNLSGMISNEIGHPNYQHPQRDSKHFSEKIDRFASFVIYTALKALSLNPQLWVKYNNDENLLFKNTDFSDPLNSKLFIELEKVKGLEKEVAGLKNACFLDFDDIPKLSDFVDGSYVKADISRILEPVERTSAYKQIAAADSQTLKENMGRKVEVIGQINKVYLGVDRNEDDYAFMNFGNYDNQILRLALWPNVMRPINNYELIKDVRGTYEKKWVKVIGVLTKAHFIRNGVKVYCPSIDIERIRQIEVVDFNQADAILQKIYSSKVNGNCIRTTIPNTNWWQQPGIK